MRVIISGSRALKDADALVARAIAESGFAVSAVLSGCSGAVDRAGERWGRRAGVPVIGFVADWQAHGRRAGPLRNGRMAAAADALIAVWNGTSRGTADMIRQARAKGLAVHVLRV